MRPPPFGSLFRLVSRVTALVALVALTHAGARAPSFQDEPPGGPPATSSRAGTPLEPRLEPAGRDERPAGPSSSLTTTVVSATRSAAVAFETPYATEVVEAERMRRRADRTLPQALRELPGVHVQETGRGQGSPYIRGFTGFRTLLLVDGVRVNNSVFRDGPNQYWNTVDPLSLARLEVVKGPSSVLYGSDAIGGTVNAITKSPYWSRPGAGGELYGRYATQDTSLVLRGEASLTRGRTGILGGASWKDFDDLRGGSEVGRQRDTGYAETDFDLKLERWLDPDTRLVALWQHVDQDDAPRTHRTIHALDWKGLTQGTDLRHDFDQKRDLVYLQLHRGGMEGLAEGLSANVSYQWQEELRQRTRGNGVEDEQGFDVGTLGAWLQLRSPSPLGTFTWGLEWYHDEVSSSSSSDPIQGPVADDARYDLFGLYAQDEIALAERLDLTLGARWTHAAAEAKSFRDPLTNQRASLSDEWDALVGSARLAWKAADSLNVFGGLSQGFRAPNLSDLTRLDSALTNELEIPSPELDPERTTSAELGLKVAEERWSAQLAGFYTWIDDAIVRVPTGDLGPNGETIVTKANVGDGYVWGVELGGALELVPAWSLFTSATYLEGMQDVFPTSAPVVAREHLDKLMPFTLLAGLAWEHDARDRWAELVAVYADRADRLSTRDQGDTSRIPPGGTPSYIVLHLRGGLRLTDGVELTAALENLTDEDYRVHGSGSNMPGRGLVLGMRASF